MMTESGTPGRPQPGQACESPLQADSEPESLISRDALANGSMLRHFIKAAGQVNLLSETERNARFEAVFASVPAGEDLWLFAYGSMLWNPTVHFAESRTVTVRDWHRSFCLRSTAGRGSAQHPGLMMGIEPGGICQGLAYRVPAATMRAELHLLWQREMLTGAYQAYWVKGVCSGKIEISLLSIVIDPGAAHYEAELQEDVQIQRIRHAQGFLGSNRDYLFKTRSHLRALGIFDEYIERLARATEQDLSNSQPLAP